MKQTFLIHQNSPRLLLFFAGWGMDERPFRHYPLGCDWMICYDYRTLDFSVEELKAYSEIRVAGWSMGVWAASQLATTLATLPVTYRIAINGTTYPVDEQRGISPAIFEGTLHGLDEANLQKFQRRMCGSANAFKRFQEIVPQRSAAELKEELFAIQEGYRTLPRATLRWDAAIIGTSDAIFPPANQQQAWDEQQTTFRQIKAAHYSEELFTNLFTPLSSEEASDGLLPLLYHA